MLPSMKSSGFTPWPEDAVREYRAAGYWTEQTIPEMLEASTQAYPEQIALVSGDQQWTYQMLSEQVDESGCWLATDTEIDRLVIKPSCTYPISARFT